MTDLSVSVEPLSVLDRVLLAIDNVMRDQGGPGFETQVLLWLDGRIDTRALREAAHQLGCHHPRLVARLDTSPADGVPVWRPRRETGCGLMEHEVTSEGSAAVVDLAARLLSTPRVLAAEDPLGLHVIHRPDGRDVFVLHFSHVLMDLYAIPALLSAVDRYFRIDRHSVADQAGPNAVDIPEQAVAALPFRKRVRAALAAIDLRGTVRQALHPTVVLGDPRLRPTQEAKQACLIARLSASQVQAIEARLKRSVGLASLSMAVLASAFRSAGVKDRRRGVADFNLSTGIGVSLISRDPLSPMLGNLAAIVPIHARAAELSDRDRLIRALNSRLRERLRHRQDLGFVALSRLAASRPRFIQETARRIFTQGMSFMYAFFGDVFDTPRKEFCGLKLDDMSIMAPGCPPAGAHLIAQKFRGGLTLQLTFVPELLSVEAGRKFLTDLVTDLTAP